MQEWIDIAEKKGYVKPSVYQGQYNLLSREYETTLFPLLRKHAIPFYAFAPLAGGFLTAKVTLSTGAEDLKGTRFEVSDSNIFGMAGRYWYDKPTFHEAMRKVLQVSKSSGIEPGDAAIRWLLYHSKLDGGNGDAVIIGPKSSAQLEQYVKASKAGPLPEALSQELDGVYEIVKKDAGVIVTY